MRNEFGFLLILCSFCLTIAAHAAMDSLENPVQQKIKGTIDKVTSDQVLLKTDEGQMRSFTIAPVNQKEIATKGLKAGDRVLLYFNQQNQVTEIDLDGQDKMENKPSPLNPNPAP